MSPSRVTLGDIADFVNGVAFKPADWEESGKRIIRIQNLTDSKKPFNRTNRAVAKKYEVAPGDLLVSWSATLGVFVWEGPDTALVNQHIFRVVPHHGRIDPNYLRHMLSDALVQMEEHLHGATMKHVNRSQFLGTKIPLPSLAEQKRIAAILDSADALRAKRREALGQLDTLLQSTFLDMFGDPVTNPLGWEVTQVEGIGSVQGGLQVTSKRRRLPIERPYLRVANVFRGFLELDELKTIRLTEAEELRTSLEHEDILIVEGHGNKEEIGRCARWDGSIVPCVHQNHLIRLRCDRSTASPLYVENYINSPGGRRSLNGTSRTTSGLNTISVSKVRRSQIQLPPLDLQHRFAAVVESIEQQKASQRAHLAELDTLFACLQSRAFRGDL